ncbi:transposase [Candidatus Poriferisodalis sp.]|uniref:transposase n=1 Tax=Candidatus Poriferisodalis sp. TaxID=3101277 RepID=UPI003B02C024
MAARLSAFERARIEAMRSAGATALDIAGVLGRHPATVYRELGRCGGPMTVYDAAAAQADASLQARRPRPCKLEADPVLAEQVKRRMTQRWSPQAISADMAAEGRRVCTETIYRAAYSGCGLDADAWADLPRGRRRRRPRSGHSDKASPLGQYRPLSERPAAVAE